MRKGYRQLAIHHNLEGLREGLSHFSGPSRAALLLALHPDDPVHIFDPQQLLRGHEPKLKELFLENEEWRSCRPDSGTMRRLEIHRFADPQLTGLIAFGGCARNVALFMWFTEEHPDICSKGPTLRWLEYATTQLILDLATGPDMRNSASGYLLQGYTLHAVRDYLVDRRSERLGLDTHLRIYPALDAILGISHTREEGAWPKGLLAFVEPSSLHVMHFLTSFPPLEQPALVNLKHCRKLLQAVEHSSYKLVTDGTTVIGITDEQLPPASIIADYRGRHGYVYLDDELICSFTGGTFQSTNRKANLVQLEEILIESSLNADQQHFLFRIVSYIVACAQERKHGCTMVLDLAETPHDIAGQMLSAPLALANDDAIDLTCSLAQVDGALHIGKNGDLLGFACLLDGCAVPGENRARGARFNSALRFTAAHSDVIVIVVSADRPVSIIQRGVELTGQCDWTPQPESLTHHQTLHHWTQSA